MIVTYLAKEIAYEIIEMANKKCLILEQNNE